MVPDRHSFDFSCCKYTKKYSRVGARLYLSFGRRLLLGLFDGYFTELLEVLHELEGSLASASASGLVTLNNLCTGVYDEGVDFGLNFFNQLLHGN